jgi:hypothetical protein
VLPETVVALFLEQDQQKACTGSNSTVVNGNQVEIFHRCSYVLDEL